MKDEELKHTCKKECGMNSYPNNQHNIISIEFDEGNECWYLIIQSKIVATSLSCIINACPFCEEKLLDVS